MATDDAGGILVNEEASGVFPNELAEALIKTSGPGLAQATCGVSVGCNDVHRTLLEQVFGRCLRFGAESPCQALGRYLAEVTTLHVRNDAVWMVLEWDDPLNVSKKYLVTAERDVE